MKPYDDQVVSVAAQVLGLRSAVERLERAAAQRENPVKAYLPLFEALNWIVAIDDRVGAIWVPEGVKLGPSWRARVSGGEVIVGLDWARNVVHHQWADALELDPVGHGLYPSEALSPSEDLFPKEDFAWVWRGQDDLPKRRTRKRRKGSAAAADEGRIAYAGHLAGRSAAETLRQGLGVCEWVAGLLEPGRPPEP
jgi:hypothetical protein